MTAVYVIPQVIFHPDWAADVEETLDISDVFEEAQQSLATMTAPYRQTGVRMTEKSWPVALMWRLCAWHTSSGRI